MRPGGMRAVPITTVLVALHVPLRGSKRLHQLSKSGAESRESWRLAGVQPLGEFTKDDADLWRNASAYKGL